MSFLPPPLPEIIKKPDEKKEAYDDMPNEDMQAPAVDPNKKVIILYTKKIEYEDYLKIERHGKVIYFNKSLINVNLNKINADYILCDANDEDVLRSLEPHFNNDKDNLYFCCYCAFYEKTHFDNMNCFSSFKDAKNKSDFDFLLLNKKNFKKVNSLLACASFLVNMLASLKK